MKRALNIAVLVFAILLVAGVMAFADEHPDVAKIKSISVLNTECSKTAHGNRGVPPAGYLKGMALTFAKGLCLGETALPLGSINRDALAAYNLAPTMVNTYALLIGLGMRQSAGKFYDGLFQASPESRHWLDLNKILLPQKSTCFMPVWKEGLPNHKGSPNSCPAFEAEWAALLIRRGMHHFGPLLHNEPKFVPACASMLSEVEQLILNDRSACAHLI